MVKVAVAFVVAQVADVALRGGMGASHAVAMAEVGERSLVVLPVRTGSGTPEDDGLVDLMGEEVQARLSRVPGIRVTSWTSALSYQGSGKRVGEIAEELGVSHVVEITAQRVDGRLRVSARLPGPLRPPTPASSGTRSEPRGCPA